jgi:hypothetical protein
VAVSKKSLWEKTQMKSARKYAGKLAEPLEEAPGLPLAAATEFRNNGMDFL